MTKKKVLIVEDDDAIATMYKLKLELSDFNVERAENGKVGLKLIDSFNPDIVLLDLMMPVMSGVETLQHLKDTNQLHDKFKLLILSNMGDVDTAEKIKDFDIHDFIVKADSSPSQVVDKVQTLLKIS
jgi:DNA-binding response OmpR family regulator